jgi:transposase
MRQSSQKGVVNRLTLSLQHSIVTLSERGWSARRIARELGIHRETVGKHLRPKPAKVTTGSPDDDPVAKPAIVTAGFSEGEPVSKPAKVTTGSRTGRSSCEPWREAIEAALDQGLSALRIHQDLRSDHGFQGGYEAVKRFVRRSAAGRNLPFRRMECAPGEEMQADFGRGAWVIEDGRRRRPHLFRCVLSHSRKGYTEVVWRQTTETFIRCVENAFRHFGGVPFRLVVDNLKAAVLHADWFDPDLNPKMVEFCRHYGTILSPTKPAMPRHKGKVEAGVDYVQENALRGRQFTSLGEQNQFLATWERSVADTRIHGTVRQQVLKLFTTAEQPALRPLPASLFPSFEEARRSVQRDGYIEFSRAYYSVPPEYVGRQLWVRSESRLLRIYSPKMEQIAVHARADPGRFATDPEHIHPHKRALIERGAEYLLGRCRLLGPCSGAWAVAMLQHRGPEAIRTLHGLLHLAKEHQVADLERVTERALEHACFRLRDLRTLLKSPSNLVQLGFLQAHPIIREMSAYRVAFPP